MVARLSLLRAFVRDGDCPPCRAFLPPGTGAGDYHRVTVMNRPAPTPPLPPTATAWILFGAGAIALLFSLAMQSWMWQVVFGLQPVAPGGGEFMVGLFIGLPALLIASLLLGLTVARRAWRSRASWILFFLSDAVLFAWITLFVRDGLK